MIQKSPSFQLKDEMRTLQKHDIAMFFLGGGVMGDAASFILSIQSGSLVDIFSLGLMYFGPAADSTRSGVPLTRSLSPPLLSPQLKIVGNHPR